MINLKLSVMFSNFKPPYFHILQMRDNKNRHHEAIGAVRAFLREWSPFPWGSRSRGLHHLEEAGDWQFEDGSGGEMVQDLQVSGTVEDGGSLLVVFQVFVS